MDVGREGGREAGVCLVNDEHGGGQIERAFLHAMREVRLAACGEAWTSDGSVHVGSHSIQTEVQKSVAVV